MLQSSITASFGVAVYVDFRGRTCNFCLHFAVSRRTVTFRYSGYTRLV